MMTIKSITFAQTDKVADLGREAVKTAVGKVNPTSTDVQNGIIGNGGEFKNRVEEAVKTIILEMTEPKQITDEVKNSKSKYSDEYKMKPIDEQIITIASILKLDPRDALEFIKSLPTLPKGSEGWFAIPKVSAIGKNHYPMITDSAELYCEAVKFVQSKLSNSRSFKNYNTDEIVPAQFRVHPITATFIADLESKQQGDIIVIPAQFGKYHRGKSVRKARENFADNEFGLGAFAVSSMIIVHPNRFNHWNVLDTDCPGDEFAPSEDGIFSGAGFFTYCDERLEFVTEIISDAYESSGSATGFIPNDWETQRGIAITSSGT